MPVLLLRCLLLVCLPVLIVSCASTDGIEPAPGAPACELVFAQGIMLSAIADAEAVKPLRINGRKPGALRWDHNQITAPAGPLTVELQAVPAGIAGLTAISTVRFEAKAGQTYRFAHRPSSDSVTTFIVADAQGQIIGVSKASRWSSPTQAPLYDSPLPPLY
jgi:hypothetical protein